MEDFIKETIEAGRKCIVKNKWEEWQITIEDIYIDSQNKEYIKEYLQDLINVLKELKDKEIFEVIENLKENFGNLNTFYTKSLAEQAAKFSSNGPKFLLQFINTFTEISQQEENRLTKYINDMTKINQYINDGLSYEEAKLMANKTLIPVSIDNNAARVIPYDSFYQGLTEDNKLIIISELSEDIILSYIFSDQENYLRYLFQDARRTIIPKLLITDKFDNIVDFKEADNLVNFNNSIILQDDLLNVHNESKKLYSSLDKEVLANVLKEIKDLKEINRLNPLAISAGFTSSSNDRTGKKIWNILPIEPKYKEKTNIILKYSKMYKFKD